MSEDIKEFKINDKVIVILSVIVLVFILFILLTNVYAKGYYDGLKDICKDFDIVINNNDNKPYCAEKLNKTNTYDRFVLNNEGFIK